MKSEGMIPLEEFGQGPDVVLPKPATKSKRRWNATDHQGRPLHPVQEESRRRAGSGGPGQGPAAQGTLVSGKIVERARGGYNVDVGIMAFHARFACDIRQVRTPETLIGETGKFRSSRFDRKTENAVVSRKLVLQDEREKKKRRVFGTIEKGQKLPAMSLPDQLRGFRRHRRSRGPLHVSDLTWGKIAIPGRCCKPAGHRSGPSSISTEKDGEDQPGPEAIDPPDPWTDIAPSTRPAKSGPGKVTSLTDFGGVRPSWRRASRG